MWKVEHLLKSIPFEMHTPYVGDPNLVFHRGCIDFNWNIPLVQVIIVQDHCLKVKSQCWKIKHFIWILSVVHYSITWLESDLMSLQTRYLDCTTAWKNYTDLFTVTFTSSDWLVSSFIYHRALTKWRDEWVNCTTDIKVVGSFVLVHEFILYKAAFLNIPEMLLQTC